jgi:hypothetical protein
MEKRKKKKKRKKGKRELSWAMAYGMGGLMAYFGLK